MGDERYQSLIDTFGREHFEKVRASKVLVVGAGGIGCELLKNLVLSGFLYIEIIDLDTIDVSNLNRQFLFRNEHVGQSKAVAAATAAKVFNPDATVIAHHGNIKDPKFGISYFEKFDIILNALDNIDARRHVNRLSLATNKPLLDSGTTGYLGQVMPIFKGKSACYECTPKPTQKVYPICTIRSTPDKPVHCIVWAKECFKLLFGNTAESMLYEDISTGESSTYMHLVAFPKPANGVAKLTFQEVLHHGEEVLVALYKTEIEKRIAMDVYKTAKSTPLPADPAVIKKAVEKASVILSNGAGNGAGSGAGSGGPVVAPSQGADWDRRVWSDEDCAVEFLLCMWEAVEVSQSQMDANGEELIGKMAFDKDDQMAMRFVCAASNLRSHVFSIPAQSFHDAKGIAGNIIPAIATTNAIVASIQVLQAFKVLKGEELVMPSNDENQADGANSSATASAGAGTTGNNTRFLKDICPYTYCQRAPNRRGLYLQPTAPDAPNPACYVCNLAQLTVHIDTTLATLGDFLKYIVKGKLGFNAPTIMNGSNILYEEGDDADEDLQENLPKMLDACPAGGIKDGCEVTIEDFTQSMEVRIVVRHASVDELKAQKEAKKEDTTVDSPGELFILGGQDALKQKQAAQAQAAAEGLSAGAGGSSSAEGAGEEQAEDEDDDDDVVMVIGEAHFGEQMTAITPKDDDLEVILSPSKRKSPSKGASPSPSKKRPREEEGNDGGAEGGVNKKAAV